MIYISKYRYAGLQASRKIVIFLFLYFISIGTTAAQNNAIVNFTSKVHTITSSSLGQDLRLQIYTPPSYSKSSQEYPVLYILDGQRYFLSGVAIQTAMRSPRAIPEMIVVGIDTHQTLRRTWFGDKKENFTNFLVNEVVPWIDSNYNTNKERVIFGWEAAAYFLSELILQKNETFNGAILTNGGYASEDKVKEFTSDKEVYLFIANSKKDIYYISSSDPFSEILKQNAPKNLRWKYRLFNDEVHESLAHLSMYKGLKYYYHNYNALVFESIQQYVDLGGLPYLTSYFEKRAARFGMDKKIDDATKNGLIWLAWKRNNFEYFSFFMEEFKDVLTTKRYASAYWQNRFGQFYLKHKAYEKAINYFQSGLNQYPNSRFEKELKEGLTSAKASTLN